MPQRGLLTEKAPLLLPSRLPETGLLASCLPFPASCFSAPTPLSFCSGTHAFLPRRPCFPAPTPMLFRPGALVSPPGVLVFPPRRSQHPSPPPPGTEASGRCNLRPPAPAVSPGCGGTLKLSNIRICVERASRAFLDKINIVLDKIEGYLSGFENQFFNSRGLSGGLSVLLYTENTLNTKT